MFGKPVFQPECFNDNNKAVIKNASILESTLNKKNNSIAYHMVLKVVARGEWITWYISSDHNSRNIQTKTISAGENGMDLCPPTSMTSMIMTIPKKRVVWVPLPNMVKYDHYKHIAAK